METLLCALCSCLFWGLGSSWKRLSTGREQACRCCPVRWYVPGRWQQKASRSQFRGCTVALLRAEYFSYGKPSFGSVIQCFSEGERTYSACPFRPTLRYVFLECFMQALERSLCGVLFLTLSSSFREHYSRAISLYVWLEVGAEAARFHCTNHFCKVGFFLAHIT